MKRLFSKKQIKQMSPNELVLNMNLARAKGDGPAVCDFLDALTDEKMKEVTVTRNQVLSFVKKNK